METAETILAVIGGWVVGLWVARRLLMAVNGARENKGRMTYFDTVRQYEREHGLDRDRGGPPR